MENDYKLTCKESTLYGYEKKIRLYLKPELGGYRVSSIDKKILQIYIMMDFQLILLFQLKVC